MLSDETGVAVDRPRATVLCPYCGGTGQVMWRFRANFPKPCTACDDDGTITFTELSTVQTGPGRRGGWEYDVHLDHRGDGGRAICGYDLFSGGFSRGGGTSGREVEQVPCAGCVEARASKYPGLPIRGLRDAITAFDEARA
jgi:hypothetical protein